MLPIATELDPEELDPLAPAKEFTPADVALCPIATEFVPEETDAFAPAKEFTPEAVE